MVVFGQNWLYSSKGGCIRATMFVFVLSDFIRMKVVVLGNVVVIGQVCCIGERWLYSKKSYCIRAKVVVFGQTLLYSSKCGCIRVKWSYSSKRCCILTKVVVFGQFLYSGNVAVFGQKWLYSDKMVLFGQGG